MHDTHTYSIANGKWNMCWNECTFQFWYPLRMVIEYSFFFSWKMSKFQIICILKITQIRAPHLYSICGHKTWQSAVYFSDTFKHNVPFATLGIGVSVLLLHYSRNLKEMLSHSFGNIYIIGYIIITQYGMLISAKYFRLGVRPLPRRAWVGLDSRSKTPFTEFRLNVALSGIAEYNEFEVWN